MDLYFTPSAEDIHIGYEFELENRIKGWKKYVVGEDYEHITVVRAISEAKIGDRIRTPYLTEAQLEEEGWVRNEGTWTKGDFTIATIINLLRDGSRRKQSMAINRGLQTVYVGEIRCINDFRKICKLIGA